MKLVIKEGMDDIHSDFGIARRNWKKYGFKTDFDDALKIYNDSEYGEPETFYAKPIYSENAWNEMVDMIRGIEFPDDDVEESLTESDNKLFDEIFELASDLKNGEIDKETYNSCIWRIKRRDGNDLVDGVVNKVFDELWPNESLTEESKWVRVDEKNYYCRDIYKNGIADAIMSNGFGFGKPGKTQYLPSCSIGNALIDENGNIDGRTGIFNSLSIQFQSKKKFVKDITPEQRENIKRDILALKNDTQKFVDVIFNDRKNTIFVLFDGETSFEKGWKQVEESLTEGAMTNGSYSLYNGWVKVPDKDSIPDQYPELEPELSEWKERAEKCKTIEEVDSFIDDVYKLRQQGLLNSGEYGKENLLFKELRNQGILGDLKHMKVELQNKEMSLEGLQESKQKLSESLKLYTDLGDYKPWSGAVDTWEKIVDADMVDDLEYMLEDAYPEGLSVTELNDLLWFEPETVFEWLGLPTDEYDESLKESIRKIKVGDEITFYSNGYKPNGDWSNKKDVLITAKVVKVYNNGAVSCEDPQGEKLFDYIKPEEILTVNGHNTGNESLKEDLSYGELATIENEWEKFKKERGYNPDEFAPAELAYEFIDEIKDVYPDEEDQDDIFGLLSTLEESLNEDEIKRYSDVVPKENRKYWYFTTHGVQPGSVPKGVGILEIRDGVSKNGMSGTFVCLDAILNTSELKEYDMKEERPVDESKEKKPYDLKGHIEHRGHKVPGKSNLVLKNELTDESLDEDYEYLFDRVLKLYDKDKTFRNKVDKWFKKNHPDIVDAESYITKLDSDELLWMLTELGYNKIKNKFGISDESLDEAVNEQDKAQSLADYLGIDPSEVKQGYASYAFETPEGDYIVATEGEAEELAEQDVIDLANDMGIQAFSADYQEYILDNFMDRSFIKEALEEELNWAEDEGEEYITSTLQEILDMVESEDTNVRSRGYKEGIEYLKELFDYDSFKAWASKHIDWNEVAEDVVYSDGAANSLARYDGREIDLGNGLYAYREN